MKKQEVIEHLANIGIFCSSYSCMSMKACIDLVFDEFEKEKEELNKKIEASKAYFDLKLDGNFDDYTFTNCNDCKHKVNGVFQEECISCKRYYACHFEKK
jgi:hypothetical protein